TLAGDVGGNAFCERAVDTLSEQLGGLDILVNNAGEQHPCEDFAKIDLALVERTFRTNIFSYIFMARAALAGMKKGASIINTASVTAYRGSKDLIDYSATKGAIVSF